MVAKPSPAILQALDLHFEYLSSDQANRVFERIYHAGDFDTPGMGFMYMTKLDKAATHIPPDVLDKIDSGEIQTIY